MADTKWNEYVGGHRGVTYNPYQDNWFMQVYERGDGMRILSPIKKCRSHWPSVQFQNQRSLVLVQYQVYADIAQTG